MTIACFHNLLQEPRGCVDSLWRRGASPSNMVFRVVLGRDREREREAPRDATLLLRTRWRLFRDS